MTTNSQQQQYGPGDMDGAKPMDQFTKHSFHYHDNMNEALVIYQPVLQNVTKWTYCRNPPAYNIKIRWDYSSNYQNKNVIGENIHVSCSFAYLTRCSSY